ncbi:MAG: hypothetical protein OXC37_03540 [Bdellovibrionaceae bacterium]|nr:hypothetical protein [Pseudobdellovibrionaceae bacterium]
MQIGSLMMFFKRIFFICLISFFTISSFAEEDLLEELGYLESEDIPCDDLPSAFKKYKDDVILNQLSMQKSLSSVIQFLENNSESDTSFKQDLLKMIEDLKNANDLIMDNTTNLSNRAGNINTVLSDCLKLSPAE